MKGKYEEFEVIHNTELFKQLPKRLVKTNRKLITQNPNIEDYTTAIKIIHISDVTKQKGT